MLCSATGLAEHPKSLCHHRDMLATYCWQWGTAARNDKMWLSPPHLHPEDFCQLVFPLMVYGMRGCILPQQVNPVKIWFHMWNCGLENNHLASLPLIYFPYDREIYTQFIFILRVIWSARDSIMNNKLKWELILSALSQTFCVPLIPLFYCILINAITVWKN